MLKIQISLTELLETDGETLDLETVRLLEDNCTSGTMSGTITNAVTGDNMSGVNLWYIKGKNKHFSWWNGGTYFGQTADNGSWTLPNPNCQDNGWRICGDHWNGSSWMINDITSPTPAGWYTIRSKKSGYYQGYHDAKACGDQADQNNSLSSTLNEGEMRIILRWPKTNPVTAQDLDSHLQIPYLTPRIAGTECDGDSDKTDKCHLSRYTTQDNATSVTGVSTRDYHQYTDIVSSGDYVTLDQDHNTNSGTPPGYETMTITKVRSGTYSYSVHNSTDRDNNTANYKTNFSKSNAKVKVFYNKEGTLVRKRFYVPNDNGTLWRVFTFDSSRSGSGFDTVKEMTYEDSPYNIY